MELPRSAFRKTRVERHRKCTNYNKAINKEKMVIVRGAVVEWNAAVLLVLLCDYRLVRWGC